MCVCVPQLWGGGVDWRFSSVRARDCAAAENATNKRNAETGNGAKQPTNPMSQRLEISSVSAASRKRITTWRPLMNAIF